MGKLGGPLVKTGKVRSQTPKVSKEEEKPKKLTGRAKRRKKYNTTLSSNNPQNFSVNSQNNQQKRRLLKEQQIKDTKSKQPHRAHLKGIHAPQDQHKSNQQ
uniref:Uncharacterized protein n=1 Tax=Arcella intermedia TaxID=1963864 RepID=A0A6B2LU43_9EUKA|eukprot:TRINITY_DN10169_c0_g1_i2.p2 TRINITY_DN10169_c0_g1~~TRINITY_DN10169_c0_g1_i2.p2  ORF type:complete len:101 (+),score=32.68 TRINITY_DN10169_c0_g1_i2:3-305(+)